MTDVIPDAETPYGRRVRERLRDEQVIWLTTVGRSGTPRPNPVWFLWTGDDVVIYNYHSARRIPALRQHPPVSLHLNSDGSGGDVVVLTGRAQIDEQTPSAHESPEFVAKYGDAMTHVSGSQEAFGRTYSVPLRVRIERVRGF